jgi:hypothetical protein
MSEKAHMGTPREVEGESEQANASVTAEVFSDGVYHLAH